MINYTTHIKICMKFGILTYCRVEAGLMYMFELMLRVNDFHLYACMYIIKILEMIGYKLTLRSKLLSLESNPSP